MDEGQKACQVADEEEQNSPSDKVQVTLNVVLGYIVFRTQNSNYGCFFGE